jgi:hypothetical protein
MLDAQTIIKELNLAPLPREGGFYKETFSSTIMVPKVALGPAYKDERAISSAIYYLITADAYSSMHRLRATEIFHLYIGGPVETTLLYANGTGEVITTGTEIEFGIRPQLIVPAGVWQGTRLAPNNAGFALLGTTMAPAFDFEDYEHGVREELIKSHPDLTDEITKLTE